jgi:hypothetical protein
MISGPPKRRKDLEGSFAKTRCGLPVGRSLLLALLRSLLGGRRSGDLPALVILVVLRIVQGVRVRISNRQMRTKAHILIVVIIAEVFVLVELVLILFVVEGLASEVVDSSWDDL